MEIILEGCEENEKSTDNQLKTNQSSDHMLESSSHSQPKSALVDVASDQPKAKRKRGRPKKESNQAIASESTGTAALPKEMPNHRTTQFNWYLKVKFKRRILSNSGSLNFHFCLKSSNKNLWKFPLKYIRNSIVHSCCPFMIDNSY